MSKIRAEIGIVQNYYVRKLSLQSNWYNLYDEASHHSYVANNGRQPPFRFSILKGG